MVTTVGPTAHSDRRLVARPVLVAGCVALAVASLALPAALTFDAWAWLVWGREIVQVDLDTTGGPSWKPLPVLFTMLVAPLGSVAVPAWLVLVRAGTLLALVGTYRLASRAAGTAAGLVAAGLLFLTPDGDPRFLRLFGEGHVAPVSVACALFAVEFHLDGRRGRALLAGFAAALLRPEAWPFLCVYALWLWWRDADRRPLVAAVLVAVPLLWLGPDWWGSGSPLHGAGEAQVSSDASVFGRSIDAVVVAARMVAVPVWAGAIAGVVSARRRGERWLLVVAGGAVVWTVLVVVMATVMGYAALSRFFLPAAAALCILAGVGAARGYSALRTRTSVPVVVAVVALTALSLMPRLSGIPTVVTEFADRATVEDDLDLVLETVGRDRLLSCGELVVDGVGLLRTGVAWKLDLPLHQVPMDLARPQGVMVVRAGGDRDAAISRQDHTETVLRSAEWVVFAIDCPSALPDS